MFIFILAFGLAFSSSTFLAMGDLLDKKNQEVVVGIVVKTDYAQQLQDQYQKITGKENSDILESLLEQCLHVAFTLKCYKGEVEKQVELEKLEKKEKLEKSKIKSLLHDGQFILDELKKLF